MNSHMRIIHIPLKENGDFVADSDKAGQQQSGEASFPMEINNKQQFIGNYSHEV